MSTAVQLAGRPTLGRAAQGTETSTRDTGWRNVLRLAGLILLSILKWIVIGALALISAALVLVSLVWGPTHWAVALVLVAFWAGVVALFVVALPRIGRGWTQLAVALGFVLVGLFTVVVSQASSYTPAIVDAQGKPVAGR
jgi:hypothetical protein